MEDVPEVMVPIRALLKYRIARFSSGIFTSMRTAKRGFT
jgi:hypothetical protein